ncbi:MAG: hypothetical protein LBT95_06780 [Treponema sp.]|nr:hypothetical protein [Treponema sp.]
MKGKGFYDPILAEVRQNREKLLEMYGGIDGLHKHMDEERPRLEKEGWRFLTEEEMTLLKNRHNKEEIKS